MENFYAYPLRIFSAGEAGGWFSTVADFHDFAAALMAHSLVNRQSLRQMSNPKSWAGVPKAMAYRC